MIPEISDLEMIKMYIQLVEKSLLEIQERMNMGVWKNDDFLHDCIDKMKTSVKSILASSTLENAYSPINILKKCLAQLMDLVRQGVYDPRSVIGDCCLDMQAFIQEIDEDLNAQNPI